jgi:hypothetical protein
MIVRGITSPFGELSPSKRKVVYVLLTRLPLGLSSIATVSTSLDLHVLGTPPALTLSQDQTLQKNLQSRVKRPDFEDVFIGSITFLLLVSTWLPAMLLAGGDHKKHCCFLRFLYFHRYYTHTFRRQKLGLLHPNVYR